ncbi:serine-rich coiled-coil domain-containing protein 2-like, partial [Arapaima gigas]
PMEDNAVRKPAMVSRLPKFGVRPVSCTSPLQNGSEQPVPRREWKSQPPGRANGMVRMSYPSALKVKTSSGNAVGSLSSRLGLESEGKGTKVEASRDPVVTREIRKPSTSFSHLRRSAPPNTLPSPCVTQQMPSAPSRGASTLSFHDNKPKGPNGLSGGPTGLYRSGLRRPAIDPSSPQVNLRPSLSHSSDSLKGPGLDNMVRSQSFPHFRQLASPVSLPSPGTRARSRSLLTKPTPVLNAKGPAAQPSITGSAYTAPSCGTKKSLLPNSTLGKPLTLSYRLMRPSLAKQQRSPPAGEVSGDTEAGHRNRDSVETPPISPDPPSETDLAPGNKDLVEDPPGHGSRGLTEGLEDMSLSSSSSLEHNDTSEDYLDDFDNLGDGGELLLLLPSSRPGLHQSEHSNEDNTSDNQRDTPIQTSIHSLLSDDVDWAGMGLSGGSRDDFGVSGQPDDQCRSPVGDFPHGSSLDLSPSDSSGGTYMWDEEGLEPLGVTTHPCGSYDSDINSMDILNNLDNLESCDLEEDDLMLDVDLPDDTSLRSDTDGTSRSELSDRGGRQAPWRNRPHRWTTQDHACIDNSRGDGYEVPCINGSQGFGIAMEELMLRDMAQDFSSVTSQLLALKKLLQMENEGVTEEDPEPEDPNPEMKEDPKTASQVEALMREAQELREELRKKEKTIILLTQQMSTSAHGAHCPCEQKAVENKQSSRDQATQTPWRGHVPQILQPPIACPSMHLASGRLTKTTSAEDSSDIPRAASVDGLPRSSSSSSTSADASPAIGLVPESRNLKTHLGVEQAGTPASTPEVTEATRPPGPVAIIPSPPCGPHADVRHLHFCTERASVRTLLPGCPASTTRTPQRNRTMVDIARPHTRAIVQPTTKQLLPPSRGLPCFSSGPPASSASSLNPSTLRPARPRGHREGSGGSEGGLAKTRGVAPLTQSRLPKPKIH